MLHTPMNGPSWHVVVRLAALGQDTAEIQEDMRVEPADQRNYHPPLPRRPVHIRAIVHYCTNAHSSGVVAYPVAAKEHDHYRRKAHQRCRSIV